MKQRVCAVLLAALCLLAAGCSGDTSEDTQAKSTVEKFTDGLNRDSANQVREAMTEQVTSQDLTEEESSRLAEIDDYIGTTAGTRLRERAELLGQEQPARLTEEGARALCEGATDFSDLFEAFVNAYGLPDLGMDYDKVYYEYWLLDEDESGLESVVLHQSFHRVYRLHADNSYEIWVDNLSD